MLSGHLQGRTLSLISKLIQPKLIIELGTYTGYSALCLAEGLTNDGSLYTIDCEDELQTIQKKYFNLSPFSGNIIPVLANALDYIPELPDDIDLVFIDADKENYLNYYKALLPKMKVGGCLIADNVLWSGKVVEGVNQNDEETLALIEFNDYIQNDDRVENLLLPIRDGLMFIRKKNND
jgi:caffeoyl-CoA O-methyltransferase